MAYTLSLLGDESHEPARFLGAFGIATARVTGTAAAATKTAISVTATIAAATISTCA